MRKITSLLMMLCMFVGAAWAQLPVVSPAPVDGKWAEGTKWYTIKQNNTNSIALSNADANGYLKLNSTSTKLIDGCWCVVGDDENGYQFYNLQAGTTQTLGAYGSEQNGRMKMYDLDVTKDGSNTLTKTFDIKKLDGQDGYAFVKNHGSTNAWWNSRDGYLAYWNSSYAYADDCDGSQYTFAEVDVTTLVDGYKTKAKAALDMVSFLGVDDEKAAIDAVEVNMNAFATIDAIVNGVAQFVAFRNGDTDVNQVRYNAYLAALMADSKGHGTKPFDWKNATWSLKYSGDGSFYIYNVNNEVYLGDPNSRGALTVTPVAAYTFAKYGETANNLFELKCGNQTLHLQNTNGDGTVSAGWALMSHANDVASSWYIETDFAALVATYKTTALTALDSWKNLSVVFDGAPIDETKTAIGAIATTNYATFAAIDAELKKVTDVVAAKMFTFQCTDTSDAKRVNVYVAANASTGKAVGADNQDYNAIWTLQHAGGSSFYLYNELNKVYLGAPVNTTDAVVLTETPVAAYTFELIENNVVEMKCNNGGTLHASNHDDDKLISYDGDQAASRWYVATIDITAELQELIDANASNYAEVPALGQYSKAGYDALVAAKNTAKTVEEVDAAIAAFKASLNRPVYFITSMHNDYAAGSAIYFDGAWKWKTANIYDKQMWMTIPGYTEENVPTVDAYDAEGTSYEICDYTTGKVMRDKAVQIVAVPEWDGAFSLQYNADGESYDAAHHAKNGGTLVGWQVAKVNDRQASAWKVEYIGNSYDLAQLTDEKIAALAGLQTAYNAVAYLKDATLGSGLGQYKGSKDAIVEAVTAAEVIEAKTLAEQSLLDVATIAAATTALNECADDLTINLPVVGKYYRFQGACEATLPNYYITGHTNADGGRIALAEDADASTIYYFDGTNLIAYQSGLVIGLSNSHWTFASVDDNSKPASTITFAGSPRKAGTYTIKSADRYFHYTVYQETVQVNRCQDDICAEHDWYITEVTTLPVTISAAGYASFYAPVEVTLPAEVTAHTVTENGEWATLSEAISVVPAENGVILAGAEGTYNLAISNTEAADLAGALAGTVAKTLITKETGAYYVLGVVEEEVGLYNPVIGEDNTKFYNAGHKAYWHIPAAAQTAGFRFGGNTTAIESVVAPAFDANAPIYDLSGRRVMNAVKGGLYIQNGKKFIVK